MDRSERGPTNSGGRLVSELDKKVATDFAAIILKNQWKCFLCRWIAEDIKLHKKLTGWPLDYLGNGIFPKEGKEKHIDVEIGEHWTNLGFEVQKT